jgi:hypothetical protein
VRVIGCYANVGSGQAAQNAPENCDCAQGADAKHETGGEYDLKNEAEREAARGAAFDNLER